MWKYIYIVTINVYISRQHDYLKAGHDVTCSSSAAEEAARRPWEVQSQARLTTAILSQKPKG